MIKEIPSNIYHQHSLLGEYEAGLAKILEDDYANWDVEQLQKDYTSYKK